LVIVAQIDISNPDQVLFPTDESPVDRPAGLTKRDLAEYYASVAPVMLPYLSSRPICMERFPDGIGGDGIVDAVVPSDFPVWIDTAEVHRPDGPQTHVLVNNARSLVYLASQGCITPHTSLSRARALDRPDQLVFGVSPPADGAVHLVQATTMLGELLNDIGLTSYLKTSGTRGYDVVVPLRPVVSFDETRTLAAKVAEHLTRRAPHLLTVEPQRERRGHRVYLDVTRNSAGRTSVPPYAVRARAGGPVSTPMEWYELGTVLPGEHTIVTLRRRLTARGDPWNGMRRRAHGLTKATDKLARLS
jgi:bifunctional non-homologous end joining protein LigD